MSLTTQDLQEIRSIVREEVRDQVSRQLEPLNNEIKALRNDIKEIYDMIAELQTGTVTDKAFQKKTIEKKLLTLNAELIATARQAGVTLPRP